MRLLFVVTGFGYGDSIRIDAIIEEIKKLKPKTEFMVLGYDKSYEYFNTKYPCLKIKGYNFPDRAMKFNTLGFLIRNLHLPFKWMKSFTKHKKTIKDFDPDIVISDFEPLGIIIARRLGIKSISVFGFDPKAYENYHNKNMILNVQAKYLKRLYEESDLVLIPSFKKQKNKGNIVYINPIIRRYKQRNSDKIIKKLRLTKRPLLVMLGGSNYGIELARKIGKINQELNQELIMFGGKEQVPFLHYVEFKEDFPDYLNICSGVITLAGNLTLSECLDFKKPALVFPIKNHVEQIMNAYVLRDIFPVEYDAKDLENSIKTFIKNKDKIIEKLDRLNIKANGARQAAEIIIKEVKI